MKRGSLRPIRALGLLVCTVLCAGASRPAVAQDAGAALQQAQRLESMGRMDLARQKWQQVLLSDPNNAEALAGMARAAKASGNIAEANRYVAQLRAAHPNDPNIAKVEQMGTAQDPTNLLRRAGQLSARGQYEQAFALLKQVYGTNPPPGDAALSYYQTEAAIEEQRPQAIAGLRALADKYPNDARYEIALGKILTYNPRTRAEGRKLLARHPESAEATEALRQALSWDQKNPNEAADLRAYVEKHPDQELTQALQQDEQLRSQQRRTGGPALTPAQRAANEQRAAEGREVQAAYAALNARRYEEAEQRFQAMLAKNPGDARALAGLGYIRMQQANFAGAISFLSAAEQNGAHDAGLEKALRDARFYYTMREATGALNENDLQTATAQFQAAVAMRPTDDTALQGLGGTLLKAGQADAAVALYTRYVKLHPADMKAWRGLFLAYAAENRYDMALGVERRFPAAIRAELMRDPDYLRTLASVYSATNREGDAQHVLQTALALPFPVDARGVRADVQMQYAALLEAAGRHEQAAGLYRQVLAADSTNTDAWVGLVQTEHTIGNDQDAYTQLQSMPAQNYQQAMQQPGFATTVAAIYMSQGHDELAQSVLEEFLANQAAAKQRPFVAAQVTLANLYLKHGDTARAFPLFETILTNNPDRPDAWKGLLDSLHATGHDREALAEILQMPVAMRRQLEADPDYLQMVGSIYAALGHPQDAMRFLGRAQQHYTQQGVAPPADTDIQTAWLLFNAHSDAALYKQLMTLGGREDLTDEQRRTVQTIWASWAVRRSQQAIAAGNPKRAIAILNAAAQAFPNNLAVLKALGSGYAAAGLPKEAVQIFKAQDLTTGTAADYRAAVGAALAANDLKDAEVWLRFGLNQYPHDAPLLTLAAKFETARGNSGRAADYYREALHAMPGPDPGAELAEEMSHAPAPARLPAAEQPHDLATLLAQPDANGDILPDQSQRPYLPSYGTIAPAPVVLNRAQPDSQGYASPASATPGSSATTEGTGVPGDNYANPPSRTRRKPSAATPTLGDYVPQSSVMPEPLPGQAGFPDGDAVLHLKPLGTYRSFVPGEPMPASDAAGLRILQASGVFVAAKAQDAPRMEAAAWHPQAQTTADGTPIVPYASVAHAPRKQGPRPYTQAPKSAAPVPQQNTVNPFAQYETPAQSKPRPATSQMRRALTSAAQQRAGSAAHARAVTGTPRYVPPPIYIPGVTGTRPAPAAGRKITYPSLAPRNDAARAAAIKANQAVAPLVIEGTSHPPIEDYNTETNFNGTDEQPAQMNSTQFNPAQMQGSQVPQGQPPAARSSLPATAPTGGQTITYDSTTTTQTLTKPSPASASTVGAFSGQTDAAPTAGQQYPQPRTGRATTTTRRRSSTTTTTTTPAAAPPQQPGMAYPVYPTPLENNGTPEPPAQYPLPPPPTDEELEQHNIPPLRGYFDPRVSGNPRAQLSEREQAQLDLALIEESYSSWLGGSANALYRSGTPGVDRLEALSVPFEASFAMGKTARFSIVPQAVFLNAGQLVLPSTPTGSPILGTLYDTATTAPGEQFATGVGGEVQFTTATLGAALGYTPYGFPVSNLIGRVRWRPGNWHFTLFGGRDPVKETMLSYAGMRDPNPANNSSIWGGVVTSGGGIRFDAGDEHSGLYIQGEGYDVTGYHVLENRRYDGTMGAYFRIHTWPEYGALNIGGTLFGEHFDYNERGETYGLGGYFSPNAYFLAAVPITFNGHYDDNLHYSINGSVGVQTFQENSQIYFPLDPAAQAGVCASLTVGTTCLQGMPVNSNTGLNYSIDAQVSYHINDHWYIGAFLSGNNTNNYNTISGGAFARYMFRRQVATPDYPTGLFPVEGFRPLRVP